MARQPRTRPPGGPGSRAAAAWPRPWSLTYGDSRPRYVITAAARPRLMEHDHDSGLDIFFFKVIPWIPGMILSESRPNLNPELEVATLRQVVGFHCRTCVTRTIEDDVTTTNLSTNLQVPSPAAPSRMLHLQVSGFSGHESESRAGRLGYGQVRTL